MPVAYFRVNVYVTALTYYAAQQTRLLATL